MRIWKNKKSAFAHRVSFFGALLFAVMSVHAIPEQENLEQAKPVHAKPVQAKPMHAKPMHAKPVHTKKSETASDASEVFKVVPQVCIPAKGEFTWNFEKEKLLNLLRQVSDLLCITIVMNADVNQNEEMTIIGKSRITPKDARDILLSSMAAKGLSLIEQGKTWMVVKKAEAKKFSTPVYTDGNQARDNEGIGTFLYKANHASIEVLKNFARALVTKDALVESLGSDTIIVIDTNSNIRRLGSFFSYADIVDAENKVRAIKLVHADAKTVEKQLRELYDLGAGGRRGRRRKGDSTESGSTLDIEKIIADERLNSLIVIGDKDSIAKLNETVALFDKPDSGEGSKGKIHVKDLRYADAKEIAETLNSVVQQDRGRRRFPRGPSEGGSSSTLFEGDVKVTAHEDTNKIVVLATANDFRALSPTIDSLDSKKAQVYVEVAILDISITNNTDFGIGLFSGADIPIPGLGSSLGMMANPGGAGIAKGISTSLAGAGGAISDVQGLGNKSVGALAVLGNFLSGGVFGIVGNSGNSQIPTFGAVLKAIQSSSNVDVLATPHLLTTDNKEAEMSVGEKVPVIRGASTVGTGGLGVPIQNISHEDVKLTFKITPHVGAEDNVRLDIFQEVNDIGDREEILGQTQYRIRTKSVKSTIVLKDQQTGVIGGLISNKDGSTQNKIPFFGDIPLLGWLFKDSKKISDRKSLLLVVTPYVIKGDEDYKKILERKKAEREEFARLYYGGKIKNYDPYKDYDKTAGPVSSMIKSLDSEMIKAENGGSGDGGETVITPQKNESEKNESGVEMNIPPATEPKTKLTPETEPEIELEPHMPNDNKSIQLEVPSSDATDTNGAGNTGTNLGVDKLPGGLTDFFEQGQNSGATNSGG